MDQLRKCFDSCLKCTLFNRNNKIDPSEKINEISFTNEIVNSNFNFKCNDESVVRTQPKFTQTSPIQMVPHKNLTRNSSLSSNNNFSYFIPKIIFLGSHNVGKLKYKVKYRFGYL
jgi:hypothetical protein